MHNLGGVFGARSQQPHLAYLAEHLNNSSSPRQPDRNLNLQNTASLGISQCLCVCARALCAEDK
jgi:hypothetical protein